MSAHEKIPPMDPILAKTVERIRAKHAAGAEEWSVVIEDCAAAGIAPVFIIEGLSTVFQISHDEAKELVVSHFFQGKARSELDRLHAELKTSSE